MIQPVPAIQTDIDTDTDADTDTDTNRKAHADFAVETLKTDSRGVFDNCMLVPAERYSGVSLY